MSESGQWDESAGSGCDVSNAGCAVAGSELIDDLFGESLAAAQHSSNTRYVQLSVYREQQFLAGSAAANWTSAVSVVLNQGKRLMRDQMSENVIKLV